MFITFNRYQHRTDNKYDKKGVITLNSNHISSLKMFTAHVQGERVSILQVIMTNGVRHHVEPQDYDEFYEVFK
jgi:hypothetical protein